MVTPHERFWENESFVFVGHTAKRGFPTSSCGELRKQGRKVYGVDPSVDEIEGNRVYRDLASLPEQVDAAVLEVPREETCEWVERAADAGIRHVWIHMGRDTPEALGPGREAGPRRAEGHLCGHVRQARLQLPHVTQVGEPAGREVLTRTSCSSKSRRSEMSQLESEMRSSNTRRSRRWLHACAIVAVAVAGIAQANEDFSYGGEPIHPACIHALAMQQGDEAPVTTAVSLEGCASSARSMAKVRYEPGDLAVIEDDALLEGGTFGYRVINQLDNGIFGLIVRRVRPDGQERVSLAAVEIVVRPMIRQGKIVRMRQIELLGELWLPGMELKSFRSMGNRVYFAAGTGRNRVERDVDFTRLGNLRH